MSAFSSTQISKPTDEQTFERACLVLFRCVLNDPNVQFNAKRGLRQNGVDIFGFRDQDHNRPVGIQCKLKGGRTRLTEKEVRDEIDKALTFHPPLREYLIVTTSSDDGDLQRIARERTIAEADTGRSITINVWGWETLEQRIAEHPEALNAFDPSYGPHAREHTALLVDLRDRQSVVGTGVVELQTSMREMKTQLLATNLPNDKPETRSELEAELDAEIDSYRDLIENGRPKFALTLLQSLLMRVAHSASGRILFRIKANIGHCHLFAGDEARAATFLAEAYHHAPAEPKAKANFALSYLLQGKASEARDFGVRELASDPSNAWLANYVIQAGARCAIDEPFADIPEALRGSMPVESAYVDFLRMRNVVPGWWRAASDAQKRHPDSDFLAQCAAEAIIDEIGQSEGFRFNPRLPPDTRQKLEDAASTLRRIWEKQRNTENPAKADGVAACANLLAAYYALGKTREALELAKDAVQAVTNSEALAERAAIAGLEAGDQGFVETLLCRLPETPDGILIRFQHYAWKADYQNSCPLKSTHAPPQCPQSPASPRTAAQARWHARTSGGRMLA